MKKIGLILFAAAIFTVSNAFAVNPTTKPAKTLSAQIQEMLEDNRFRVNDDLTADVRFTLNNEGEIVVLSVATFDEGLESFVKNRLNYKKVQLAAIQEGKVYTVPVRITA